MQLARVATPESGVILLSRHQVQSLKINQFGGSLDGLLAEKKRRQNQAFERRVKAMNDYEVRSEGRKGGREKWREGWTDTTYPSLLLYAKVEECSCARLHRPPPSRSSLPSSFSFPPSFPFTQGEEGPGAAAGPASAEGALGRLPAPPAELRHMFDRRRGTGPGGGDAAVVPLLGRFS